MNKKFFSQGKVILSGEHSVVYGQPALVSAIDLGITAASSSDKKTSAKNKYLIHIKSAFKQKYLVTSSQLERVHASVVSNLPEKSGLGSSAAFAHATILFLLDYFGITASKEKIFELVLESEKFVHNNPSGVDPSAVVFGGLQSFKKKNGSFEKQFIQTNLKIPFLLVDSGPATESTAEMVDLVKNNLVLDKSREKILEKIGAITTKMQEKLTRNSFDPALLTQNQRLLEELGVVGKKAKRLVFDLESLGAYVKITGAGGVKSGSGLLLVFHPKPEILEKFIEKNNFKTYKITI